jgi:hypothetical protein
MIGILTSEFLIVEINFKIFSDTNKCNIIYKCNKGRGCFQATGTPKMQSQTDNFTILKLW